MLEITLGTFFGSWRATDEAKRADKRAISTVLASCKSTRRKDGGPLQLFCPDTETLPSISFAKNYGEKTMNKRCISIYIIEKHLE